MRTGAGVHTLRGAGGGGCPLIRRPPHRHVLSLMFEGQSHSPSWKATVGAGLGGVTPPS